MKTRKASENQSGTLPSASPLPAAVRLLPPSRPPACASSSGSPKTARGAADGVPAPQNRSAGRGVRFAATPDGLSRTPGDGVSAPGDMSLEPGDIAAGAGDTSPHAGDMSRRAGRQGCRLAGLVPRLGEQRPPAWVTRRAVGGTCPCVLGDTSPHSRDMSRRTPAHVPRLARHVACRGSGVSRRAGQVPRCSLSVPPASATPKQAARHVPRRGGRVARCGRQVAWRGSGVPGRGRPVARGGAWVPRRAGGVAPCSATLESLWQTPGCPTGAIPLFDSTVVGDGRPRPKSPPQRYNPH